MDQAKTLVTLTFAKFRYSLKTEMQLCRKAQVFRIGYKAHLLNLCRCSQTNWAGLLAIGALSQTIARQKEALVTWEFHGFSPWEDVNGQAQMFGEICQPYSLRFIKVHCLFNDTNVVVPGVDPTLSCPSFSFAELNFFGTATYRHLCKLEETLLLLVVSQARST